MTFFLLLSLAFARDVKATAYVYSLDKEDAREAAIKKLEDRHDGKVTITSTEASCNALILLGVANCKATAYGKTTNRQSPIKEQK